MNSNDTYSRLCCCPANNCHHFTIMSNDSAAEALQNRILQCNQYKIISFTMSIQNNKGICELDKVPYSSPVAKTKLLQHVPTPAANPLDKSNCKSIFGLTMYNDYITLHENLGKLHVKLTCSSLQQNEEEVMHGQKCLHKLPPYYKVCCVYAATMEGNWRNDPFDTFEYLILQ